MNNLRSYFNRISSRNPSASDALVIQPELDGNEDAPTRSRKYDDRVADFEKCLLGPVIPLHICRMLCFGGIPDCKGLRPLCWKILLGYLPTDKTLWPEVLEKRRAEYEKLATTILINPFQEKDLNNTASIHIREVETNPLPQASGVDSTDNIIDNPLLIPKAGEKETPWTKFFDNNHLHAEIEKDVLRTHSGMHFFSQKLECSESYPKSIGDNEGTFLCDLKSQTETHHDVMARILFLFAKLNPGVRYVQGMNELLAPIYYVFAQDPDESFRHFAEADAFFCFTDIMAELKDRFIASLDCSDLGISSCIEGFRDLLRKTDPELYLHLERQLVDARYYSLRWLTLLCSQEFRLPDVLRLWDSLFSDPFRFDFLQYCCCAMLICIRSQLLSMDYAGILQTLQAYPETDLLNILNQAEELMRKQTGRHLTFAETGMNAS